MLASGVRERKSMVKELKDHITEETVHLAGEMVALKDTADVEVVRSRESSRANLPEAQLKALADTILKEVNQSKTSTGLFDEVLEEFGLTEHGTSLPVALSSGQRRRLLLAAGFVRPRALLVLDEPEQRLDLRMRLRLAERLLAEKASGGAVLLATHDPALLRAVADRAVLVADDVSRLLSAEEAAVAIEQGPR